MAAQNIIPVATQTLPVLRHQTEIEKAGEGRILPAVTSNKTNLTTITTTIDTAEDKMEKKWVINLSSSPLTQVQASLLAHGPGYAVTPKHPLYGDYIVAIEKACSTLYQNRVEMLRAEIPGEL